MTLKRISTFDGHSFLISWAVLEISDAVKGQSGCVAMCSVARACGEITSWVAAIVGSRKWRKSQLLVGAKVAIPKEIVCISTGGEERNERDVR